MLKNINVSLMINPKIIKNDILIPIEIIAFSIISILFIFNIFIIRNPGKNV